MSNEDENNNINNDLSNSDNNQIENMLNQIRDINNIRELNENSVRSPNAIFNTIHQQQMESTAAFQRKMRESVHDYILSTKVLLISPLALTLLISFLLYEIKRFIDAYSRGEIDINAKILENYKFWFLYTLLFFIFFFIFWFIFLLAHKIITQFEHNLSYHEVSFTIENMIFFNPFYGNLIFYYFDRNFISTVFDGFVIIMHNTFIALNFLFSTYSHFYFKQKIAGMTRDEGKLLMTIKSYYSFVFFLNLFSLIFIELLVPFTMRNIGIIFLLFIRHLYLLFEHTKMYFTNYVAFRQIEFSSSSSSPSSPLSSLNKQSEFSSYSTDEKKFIKNQYIRILLNILISMTIMMQFSFNLYLVILKSNLLIIIPSIIIVFKCTSSFLSVNAKLIRLIKFINIVDRE